MVQAVSHVPAPEARKLRGFAIREGKMTPMSIYVIGIFIGFVLGFNLGLTVGRSLKK